MRTGLGPPTHGGSVTPPRHPEKNTLNVRFGWNVCLHLVSSEVLPLSVKSVQRGSLRSSTVAVHTTRRRNQCCSAAPRWENWENRPVCKRREGVPQASCPSVTRAVDRTLIDCSIHTSGSQQKPQCRIPGFHTAPKKIHLEKKSCRIEAPLLSL